jgi:hypothetical protein
MAEMGWELRLPKLNRRPLTAILAMRVSLLRMTIYWIE